MSSILKLLFDKIPVLRQPGLSTRWKFVTYLVLWFLFLPVKGLSLKLELGKQKAGANKNEINEGSLEKTIMQKTENFLRTYYLNKYLDP